MAKGIIIAKNMKKANILEDDISLEENVSDEIYGFIEFDKDNYHNIWAIVKEFYGPDGDFVFSTNKILDLKKEIVKLLQKIKRNKSVNEDVVGFLKGLLALCNRAIKNNLNLYGFAD